MCCMTYVTHVTGWSQSYNTEKVIESSEALSKIVLYSIVRVMNDKLHFLLFFVFVFVFVFYFVFIFFSLLFRIRV